MALRIHINNQTLGRLGLSILMIVVGIGAIGLPTLANSVQLISNAKLKFEPLQPEFTPPLAISFELRYANGELVNASSVLPRYTGSGGPVFGSKDSEISFAAGTQLLWGGSVHDSRGYPAASINIGLYYFIAKDGCDETRQLSCYTETTLVATTKTNPDGTFGFPVRNSLPNQKLPAWSLPEITGKVIIVYADFVTLEVAQREKAHYAIRLSNPPAVTGIWIDDLPVVNFGQNIQYTSVDSGNVRFSLQLQLSQQAYLHIGKCGPQGCFNTPPLESTTTLTIANSSSSVNASLSRAHYLFYISTSPTDPFKSAVNRDAAFSIGTFDTLHNIAPTEYQLLGLVPLGIGLVLLLTIPFSLVQDTPPTQHLLRKIKSVIVNHPLRTVMGAAGASRLFIFMIAIASSSIFGEPLYCQNCWDIAVPFINLFARYDSGYYIDIALHGYSNSIVPRWEFFPGYPVTIGILGRGLAVLSPLPLELTLYTTGFIISNLSFFGCVYYLFKLSATVLRDNKLAFYSTLGLAFYPAGVFLSAAYSESLFLLLMLSSLYYWRVEEYGKSAVLGFFEALTRPVGILLVVPFLIEVARDKKQRRAANYLPVVTVLLGFLTFLAFSQLMTGTPFAQFDADRLYWAVTPSPPRIIQSAIENAVANPIIVPYVVISVGGLLTSFILRKNRAETAIDAYGLALLFTYPYTGLISIARYSITLISAYWGYARWMQRHVLLVLAIFLVLLAIGVGLFVNWYAFY
jgi:hypothetical protein